MRLIFFLFAGNLGLAALIGKQPPPAASTPDHRRPPHIVIELGSNVGDWMRPYLAVHPGAVPVMVEAQPQYYADLRALADAHGGTFYPAVAWSSGGGNMTFYDVDDGGENVGSSVSSAHAESEQSPDNGNAISSLTLPTVDVVDLITAHVRPGGYSVLRMDIEGAEHEVVRRLLTSGALCRLDELWVESHAMLTRTAERMHLLDLTVGWLAAGCVRPPGRPPIRVEIEVLRARRRIADDAAAARVALGVPADAPLRIPELLPGCHACPIVQVDEWMRE